MTDGANDSRVPSLASPFPPLHLSDDEKHAILHKVDELVSESLVEYEQFLSQDRATVSENQWKLVTKRDGMTAYRKRRESPRRSDMSKVHSVLVVGEIEGAVEDILLGGVHVSPALTSVFKDYLYGWSSALNSALLCSIIEPTLESPARMVRIVWDLLDTFYSTLGSMVKPRDFVVAVASGITINTTGERIVYGFSHSVDVASAPHVPHAIRATRHATYLYRQVSPNRMHVYITGRLDLKGRIPTRAAVRLSIDAIIEVATRIIRFSGMKKRTFLVNQQQQFSKDSVGDVFPFGLPPDLAIVESKGDCNVCGRRSSNLLGLRKSCTACRKPACSACIESKRVIVSRGTTSKPKETLVSIKKLPFCLTCEQRATELSSWDLCVIESDAAVKKHDGKMRTRHFSQVASGSTR